MEISKNTKKCLINPMHVKKARKKVKKKKRKQTNKKPDGTNRKQVAKQLIYT